MDRLQGDAERLARDARREQPQAAAGLEGAAGEIRDSRLRDRIAYSRSVIRSGSPEYANEFEGQIGEYLESIAEQFERAAGAVGESAERRQERALERARDLVRGLESLRERAGEQGTGNREQGQQGERGTGNREQGQEDPVGARPASPGQQGQQGQQGQGGQGQQGQERGQGGGGGNAEDANASPTGQPRANADGDARQFTREWQLRRRAAEELRDDLRQQGVETGELDRAINDLRRLESGRPLADARGLEELQAALIDRLKTYEFTLWRQFRAGSEGGPALGTAGQVPPEYRAMVEEYYRSLARPRP